MARIGYLALRQGEWNGKQIFPKAWMQDMVKMLTPVSDMNPDYRKSEQFGYGYMWWIFDPKVAGDIYDGAFTARGSKGQYITIIPKLDLVVAFKTLSTATDQRSTKFSQYAGLLDLIIKAYKGVEN
jgi:CubicO group peptidase (beta-lactamase class C family)